MRRFRISAANIGTEPVLPGTHRLVADIDPTFMKKVLDLSQRQRKAHVHHHCKPDDLGRRLEVAKWIGHAVTLRPHRRRLKSSSSDTASPQHPES